MLNFIYEKVFATFCLVICIFSNDVLGNNDSVRNCTCGQKIVLQPKIMGGIEAEENEFPWQAIVYILKNFRCSASIINNLYLLSEAHTFNRFRENNNTFAVNVTNISAVLGTNQRGEFSKYEEVREIIEVIFNEKNLYSNLSHDITLLKMKEPLTRYTSKINPICLPPCFQKFENIPAITSGWGREHEKGESSQKLRKTNVTVLPNSQCNEKISWAFSEDIMMCSYSSETQACRGDSGGPLMIINEFDKYEQIGIVSYGFGCKAPFYPVAYTRVNYYLQWIHDHTSDATYCDN
ncbi:UNVERIFIED_CONTAM: hypothetical protein RMT77_003293 [Armadillidium vulgare]